MARRRKLDLLAIIVSLSSGATAVSSSTTGLGDYILSGLGGNAVSGTGALPNSTTKSAASSVSYINSTTTSPTSTDETATAGFGSGSSPLPTSLSSSNATWTWPWTTTGCVNTTIPDRRTTGLWECITPPCVAVCASTATACLSLGSIQAATCSPQWNAYYSASESYTSSLTANPDASSTTTTNIFTGTNIYTEYTSTSTASEIATNRDGTFTPVYVFGKGVESYSIFTDAFTNTDAVGSFTPKPPCCSITATQKDNCGICSIDAGSVQLLYWPPSNSSLSSNGTNSTSTITAPPVVATTLGLTLTSPSVYISFNTIYATNDCSYVGHNHTGSVIAMRPQDVSSVVGFPAYIYEPLNYSNLAIGEVLPLGIYEDACIELCQTIVVDEYEPYLSVPSAIRSLDPAWATCLTNLYGLYDPPIALSQEKSVAQATVTSPGAPQALTTTQNVASPSVGSGVQGPAETSAAPCSAPSKATPTNTNGLESSAGSPQSTIPAASSEGGTQESPSEAEPSPSDSPVVTPLPEDSTEISTSPEAAVSTANPGGPIASILHSDTTKQESPGPDTTTPAGDSSTPSSSGATGTENALSVLESAQATTAEPDPATSATESTEVKSDIGTSELPGPGSSVASTALSAANSVSSDPGSQSDPVLSVFSGHSLSATVETGDPAAQITDSPAPAPSGGNSSPTASSPSQYVVDGKTLAPGSTPVVVSGTTYSLGTSATNLVVNGMTQPLSQGGTSTGAPPIVIAGHTYTANAASQYSIALGETLASGSPAVVVSGTTYPLDPSASEVVINGVTQALSAVAATGTPGSEVVVDGTTYTEAPSSALVIAGQSLDAGSQITIDGTTYSLAPSGSDMVINGVTQTFDSDSDVLTLGSATFTETRIGSESGFVVDGQTLTKGGTITIGSGAAAETLRLLTTGGITEVVFGSTSTETIGDAVSTGSSTRSTGGASAAGGSSGSGGGAAQATTTSGASGRLLVGHLAALLPVVGLYALLAP